MSFHHAWTLGFTNTKPIGIAFESDEIDVHNFGLTMDPL